MTSGTLHSQNDDATLSKRENDCAAGWRTGQRFVVIPGQLHFTIHADAMETQKEVKSNRDLFFFSSANQSNYMPYCDDFGPVDLAQVVSFCVNTREVLRSKRLHGREAVFYCELDEARRTNAAFLLASYLVVVEGFSPEDAAEPFLRIEPSPFKAFRDATHLPCDFDLTLLDCLRGLYKAFSAGWFSISDFDAKKFQAFDAAGLSRICPKFIAFKGPATGPKRPHFAERPSYYVPTFRAAGVSAVVRLNDGQYAPAEFEAHGFRHYDLPFDDCGTPSFELIHAFMDIVRAERGVVAVHCLAGLGRTGTLIALALIADGWGAREAIAWLRIARPGSVIGAQQHFLCRVEAAMAEFMTLRSSSCGSAPSTRAVSRTSSGLTRASSDGHAAPTRRPPAAAASAFQRAASAEFFDRSSIAFLYTPGGDATGADSDGGGSSACGGFARTRSASSSGSSLDSTSISANHIAAGLARRTMRRSSCPSSENLGLLMA